ncbi:TATA element modulatory factor [Cylas formicarius]|uniref:TATA element modulatory factor n=1 Tax=Cylas formicarius TaxID=197179 RepID=UPI002958D379|nr:TATA element modulatory factor [Cylas formicarius]
MSWFDAGALANIAKSALKEAQKTIDKALDIKENVDDHPHLSTPVDTNSDDFFGTWGVIQSGEVVGSRRHSSEADAAQNKLATSLWGSFTGSFFDNARDVKSISVESLDDSGGHSDFSKSKLVVQHSEDIDVECELGERFADVDSNHKTKSVNRLSGVSSESGKNSSESVDVLTPDSDILSAGVSSSSSAGGLRNTSGSVEVLGDSLASPSSVEVIDSTETNRSQCTDDYVSPSDSPQLTDKATTPLSPDSVEVIAEEQDECSMAEDTVSYTSVSESTSATVLDTSFNVPPKTLEGEGSAITQAPVRSIRLLPLPQVNQVLIDTQPHSTNKQDLPVILEKTNIIDFPRDEERGVDQSVDDGSQSDRTVVGSEDNVMESSSDTTTDVSTNSASVKKMLADAMTEKIRESSPLSSERSDLVKVGSDNTSCHTSCDELETTTSSDIEIISSPNGDSSSTRSRRSPARPLPPKPDDCSKKSKGHNREPSETSSISDDPQPNGEVDRLLKRISEMTEILESRETKLIDMTRRNAELLEQNTDLKNQLDCVLTQQLESADVTQVTEEYTQRLAALEKKFQQAIREKDTLRKQLDQAIREKDTRPSKSELESKMATKDQLIKELREEGEKLSKQQLQHSNIIKKLRAKEKEQETTIKHLKESHETLSLEADRLKKSLSAKEEVERTQIEAVNRLTIKNKKLEGELTKTRSQLDDLTQRYDATKKSLEAAKKELAEKSRTVQELQAGEELLRSLQSRQRMTESQNEEVLGQLDDLRCRLRVSEEEYLQKEHKLRLENAELLRRLEEAGARNEELSQSVLEVSKPLVRQLESLQATHSAEVAGFEKMERELTLKISDLKSKLRTSASLERSASEECVSLRARLADLEGQLGSARHRLELLGVELERQKTNGELTARDLQREIEALRESLANREATIERQTAEIESLQRQMAADKTALEVERKRLSSLQESSIERSVSNSPTLSIGKASIPESLSGSFWSQDEPFEASHAPRYANVFEMQTLQSNLKQREGEVQQLQWELSRREQERSLLNMEISTLLTRVEGLETTVKAQDELRAQFVDLQRQYDTLCQLYGEKVEENDELKLDLADVKEMYKSQIDELLKQQRQAR